MSENEHRLIDLSRTAPMMEVPEIYSITKGLKKDFELKGYHVPSTSLYSPRQFKFSIDKKKDKFYEISKRAKDPDPSTYSPKHDQMTQRYWTKANGKFLKCKRETTTEEAIRLSPRVPGPGDYLTLPKGSSQPLRKALLGKFE